MFNLPVDCLNIVFSFGTPREMGRCMTVSKEARKTTRACGYAWYEMYCRVYSKKLEFFDTKHKCEYGFDCTINPHYKNFKATYKTYRKRIYAFKDLIRQRIPDSIGFMKYTISALPQNFGQSHTEQVEEICQNEAHKKLALDAIRKTEMCFNPEHFDYPIYKAKTNYRRLLRKLYIQQHKRVRFTQKDEEKLQELLRKKRIYECRLLRKLYIQQHKRVRFTQKDEEKLQELLRKKRIYEYVSQYE